MAIVINGSGTVTGLAVGGLPDGTVDAGTLATDSVVTGKIADGTIANADIADLAASKLTGALPAISGASLTGITTGKLLQVVFGDTTTAATSTSTTWVDTTLTATITPSSTSSKIYISVHQNCENGTNGLGEELQLLRDSTSAVILANAYRVDAEGYQFPISFSHLDSPSTTSAIVYKTQMRHRVGNTGTFIVQYQSGASSGTYTRSQITLMEIAG